MCNLALINTITEFTAKEVRVASEVQAKWLLRLAGHSMRVSCTSPIKARFESSTKGARRWVPLSRVP